MSDIFINIPDPNAWVRNPDWLPLPELNEGDKKFYGLFAVFSGSRNDLTLRHVSSGATMSIDWGDGISEGLSTTTDVTHYYDYSTITSSISSDPITNTPYKQVIVECGFTNTTNFYPARQTPSTGSATMVPWLDVVIDNSDMTYLHFNPRRAQIMERLRVLNSSLSLAANNSFQYTPSLKVLDIDLSPSIQTSQTFDNLGNVRTSNGDLIPMNFISSSTMANTFRNSILDKVGDIYSPQATTFRRLFIGCDALTSVGEITATSATTISSIFYTCQSLRKAGPIITSSSLDIIESAYRGCYNIEEIEITDCSNVTDTTNFLLYNSTVKSLTLTGLTVGVIAPGNMEAEDINAFFTSLGTASGSQTVTVTSNPGSSTCDTSIATGKGWTVVT